MNQTANSDDNDNDTVVILATATNEGTHPFATKEQNHEPQNAQQRQIDTSRQDNDRDTAHEENTLTHDQLFSVGIGGSINDDLVPSSCTVRELGKETRRPTARDGIPRNFQQEKQ